MLPGATRRWHLLINYIARIYARRFEWRRPVANSRTVSEVPRDLLKRIPFVRKNCVCTRTRGIARRVVVRMWGFCSFPSLVLRVVGAHSLSPRSLYLFSWGHVREWSCTIHYNYTCKCVRLKYIKFSILLLCSCHNCFASPEYYMCLNREICNRERPSSVHIQNAHTHVDVDAGGMGGESTRPVGSTGA